MSIEEPVCNEAKEDRDDQKQQGSMEDVEALDAGWLRDEMVRYWREYQQDHPGEVSSDLTFVPNSLVLLDLLLKDLREKKREIMKLSLEVERLRLEQTTSAVREVKGGEGVDGSEGD